MEYQEVLQNARTCMGPYCKACPVCNGQACKNTIPGPGAKGSGTGFARNYQKWQELRVNLDTIGENRHVLRLIRPPAGPAGDGGSCGRHAAALRR